MSHVRPNDIPDAVNYYLAPTLLGEIKNVQTYLRISSPFEAKWLRVTFGHEGWDMRTGQAQGG